MPLYTMKDNNTGEVYDVMMKYDDKKNFLAKNPHISEIIGAPQIVGGRSGGMKETEGFKEVMSKIGDKFPGSNVDNRYNTKTNKQIKTAAVVEKHIKKQGL